MNIKVQERVTGKILEFDHASSEMVDLGAETGAKGALEKAADSLAEKLLPLLSK